MCQKEKPFNSILLASLEGYLNLRGTVGMVGKAALLLTGRNGGVKINEQAAAIDLLALPVQFSAY